MDKEKIMKLLSDQKVNSCLNIECNDETSTDLLAALLEVQPNISHVFKNDELYEVMKVRDYLKFVAQLSQSNVSVDEALKALHLEDLQYVHIKKLNFSQKRRVCFARAMIVDQELFFLQEPILNLDDDSLRYVLQWIEKLMCFHKKVITTSVSLKHASLIVGTHVYVDQREVRLVEISKPSESSHHLVNEKISARCDEKILLFNPNEIDYIESIDSKSFLNIRNNRFACPLTMDELEGRLRRYGFYRSHRSYLVNMQKVQEIVKWTRNSYSLKLENLEDVKIPLSKGRIEEMRDLYHF